MSIRTQTPKDDGTQACPAVPASASGKPEANSESDPPVRQLVALREHSLTTEAAERMAQLLDDSAQPAATGQPVPEANAELVAKVLKR